MEIEKWERKENICLYCETPMKRPSRHFQQKHKNIEEVANILQAPKGERRGLFNELISKGNWTHNQKVLQTKTGQLCLKKQTLNSENVKTKDVIPCGHCHNLYKKRHLWKHYNVCPKNPNPEANKGRAKRHGLEELPPSYKIKEAAERHIINRLREDATRETLVQDEVLLDFLNTSIEVSFHQNTYKHLRARIRALIRFLESVRQVREDELLKFRDILLNLKQETLLPAIEIHSKNFKVYNNLEQLRSDIAKIYEDQTIAENRKEKKEALKT